MPGGFRSRSRSLSRRAGLFDVSVVMHPAAVQVPILRDARIVLRKWATFVRREARRQIRPAKSSRVSRPNARPKSRTHRLKNNIFWNYNEARMLSIVGARMLPNTVSKTAAKALEHGGRSQTAQSSNFGSAPRYVIRWIRKRPFMAPAAKTIDKKIPNLWRKQGRLVRGGIVK